jgi:hypothetical protein
MGGMEGGREEGRKEERNKGKKGKRKESDREGASSKSGTSHRVHFSCGTVLGVVTSLTVFILIAVSISQASHHIERDALS